MDRAKLIVEHLNKPPFERGYSLISCVVAIHRTPYPLLWPAAPTPRATWPLELRRRGRGSLRRALVYSTRSTPVLGCALRARRGPSRPLPPSSATLRPVDPSF